MQKSKGKSTGQKSKLLLTFKFFFVLLTFGFLLLPSAVSAHFVKSNAGIGAVLHVDPGDDPVAQESSSIILEYKDTNNRFDLSKCNCRLIVSKDGQEILSEMIHPVAPDQKLSSVTPVVFPEKNIYKLQVKGTAINGEFPDFELSYDVRVAKEPEMAEGMVHIEEKGWLEKNIIFVVGGALFGALLLGAFLNSKKKIAVIILMLLVLAHSLPVKAIHASHNGPIQSENFTCCLPAAALIPELPEIIELPVFSSTDSVIDDDTLFQETGLRHFIRPPPLS